MQKWKEYLPIIILTVLGIGFLGYGLKELFIPKAPVVEIIKANTSPSPTSSSTPGTIVVDVAGAVENPGVYTLPLGSRVSDALIAAGGLAVTADKNYLARSVNLASIVPDGSKIYILKKGEAPTVVSASTGPATFASAASGTSLISINTASVTELDQLWGIGTVRAQDIISNRPYTNLEELKSKAKIPSATYDKIKSNIAL